MFYVTKHKHVRLDGGRSVVLREGARGLQKDYETGEVVDADARLRKSLPESVLASLIADGTIVER